MAKSAEGTDRRRRCWRSTAGMACSLVPVPARAGDSNWFSRFSTTTDCSLLVIATDDPDGGAGSLAREPGVAVGGLSELFPDRL